MSISEIQREELKSLIRKLLDSPSSDEESNKLGEQINRLSPDPDILGYIFWSHKYGITKDVKQSLPQEELIELALKKVEQYKPIILSS